jgi:hypothetical protein
MTFTLSKWGLGSPSKLPKFHSSISGVKTACIESFFISLESYQSVDIENGLAWAIRKFAAQVMTKRNVGSQKVENRPDPGVFRWSATHCWKALDESYKFASNLIPIGGLSKKLWPRKVARVQTGVISGLLLGSPEIKNHLNVGAAERCREYYMGEGGGFPRVQAVVSLLNPESPVACPSTKCAPESELTNLLVGWMQIRMSN